MSSKSLAKLRDTSRATLSRVTWPLDVSQFSHLGDFVARDKICSEKHAMASGGQQKYFLSLQPGRHVACLSQKSC